MLTVKYGSGSIILLGVFAASDTDSSNKVGGVMKEDYLYFV